MKRILSALVLGLALHVPMGLAQGVMQLSLKRAVDIALTPEGSARVALAEQSIRVSETRLNQAWGSEASATNADGEKASIEPVQAELRALSPDTNAQRLLQSRALQVSGDIAEAHWLLTESVGDGLPWAFLAVLIFWLGLLFVTFGLLAPTNATVIGLLFACALSVTAAVFLIVDMAHPYIGIIHVSDAPLRTALEQLGQK